MAEIKYIICDRCKRKISDEDYYKLELSQIPKIKEITCMFDFDICEDCRKKFYEFLKEGKADENA